MRSALSAGLVASAWLVQQAVSTGWGDSPTFSSVSNTNNNCSADQQSGFDWSGLPTGSFNSFGGFGFGGFFCQDSFKPNNKKRSLRTRDDFQVKLTACDNSENNQLTSLSSLNASKGKWESRQIAVRTSRVLRMTSSQSRTCKFPSPSTPSWTSSSVCLMARPASTLHLAAQEARLWRTASVAVLDRCRSRCLRVAARTVVTLAFTPLALTATLRLRLLPRRRHLRLLPAPQRRSPRLPR